MTSTSGCHLELHLPNHPEFMVVARLMVAAVASRLQFDMEAINDIKLAVGEACNNAMEHGCSGKNGTEMITLRCEITDDSLNIFVQDCGTGFSPEQPGAKQQETIDLLAERGFGMLLIRTLMDEVTFNSTPGSGTLVKMVKHRQPTEGR